MARSIITLILLGAAACHRGGEAAGDPRDAAGLGICTQEEPGTVTKSGQAVFQVDTTPTAAGARVGRFAIMLSCVSPGPAGAAVTMILPNLSDSVAAPGRYRVQGPGVVPAGDDLAELAWAEALIPTRNGITYRGMGGELVLEKAPTGGLVGSYLVAFERAPEVEHRGPAQLVIGGAFAATRNRLPRVGAPRAPGR